MSVNKLGKYVSRDVCIRHQDHKNPTTAQDGVHHWCLKICFLDATKCVQWVAIVKQGRWKSVPLCGHRKQNICDIGRCPTPFHPVQCGIGWIQYINDTIRKICC